MDENFELIYIMLGVNNLSQKKGNGTIVQMFDDVPSLVEFMLAKFEIFKCQLKEMSSRIVLCQMIGLNYTMYNKNNDVDDAFQQVINESMPLLAHTLNLVNSDENLIGPWITKIVHYWLNHKQYNAYGKLCDGIHYSEQTKRIIAKKIVESIKKNLNLTK